MGLFGSYKPKVTEQELKRARNDMAAAGLSMRERDEMTAALGSHLKSDLKSHHGLDEREIDATIESLKGTPDRHQDVSDAKLDKARSILKKYL